MTEHELTPTQPYILRAFYEWMLDNGLTPQVLVDAEDSKVNVPKQYVKEGRILLNIHSNAVQNLELGNEWIMFSARFSGRAVEISFPVACVLAIIARENGTGVKFHYHEDTEAKPGQAMYAVDPADKSKSDDEDGEPPPTHPPSRKKPNLKVIK